MTTTRESDISPQTSNIVHNILVVEDDRTFATSLKEILQLAGFSVSLAKDGGQAHATFVVKRPDFVILDLMLPGESGFEICEHMKHVDESVPIVILSAIDMDDSRELGARVGADGYFAKPVDPEVLVEQIKTIADRVWRQSHGLQKRESVSRIRFTCRCGKRFHVSTVHRGRSMTCPQCGDPLVVPRHD